MARSRAVGLALAIGVAAIAGLDLGLRAIGVVPPDDPLLFFHRTHVEGIDSSTAPTSRGSIPSSRGPRACSGSVPTG
jgi:hypothetical protein